MPLQKKLSLHFLLFALILLLHPGEPGAVSRKHLVTCLLFWWSIENKHACVTNNDDCVTQFSSSTAVGAYPETADRLELGYYTAYGLTARLLKYYNKDIKIELVDRQ